MTAMRVRGDFKLAHQIASRPGRRPSSTRRVSRPAGSYPGDGQPRGRDPYRAAVDELFGLVGATVRDWRGDRQGFAFLGSKDRGVSIPEPVDAESCIVALHEGMHHGMDDRWHRDEAIAWRGELDTWRAALAWYRQRRLPDVAVAEAAAIERLSGRPEARRFRRGTVAQALRERPGVAIRETPAATVTFVRGFG